jgi:exonuclease III
MKQEKGQLRRLIEEYVGQKCYSMHGAMVALKHAESKATMLTMPPQRSDSRAFTQIISDNKSKTTHTGSIMTMNMRAGMSNKLDSTASLQLWNVMSESDVVSAGIQDHELPTCNTSMMRNMRYSLKQYHNHHNQAISQGHRGVMQTLVGGTALFNGGAIAQNTVGSAINDERGWGRWSGRIIEGQKDEMKLTNLAIITCYIPCSTDSEGGAWKTQERRMNSIPAAERQLNPRMQALNDLAQLKLTLERKHHCNVIIMGDFNINMNKKNTKRNTLVKWAINAGMVNASLIQYGHGMTEQLQAYDALKAEEKIYTFYQSEKETNTVQTFIDHIWVSNDLYLRGCVLGSGVMRSQVAGSDHRPLLAHIDFTEALGMDCHDDEEIAQSKRIFMYVNESQRKLYREHAAVLWEERELSTKISQLYQKCLDGTVTRDEMNIVMAEVVKTLLDAEQKIDENIHVKRKKKFKQGWSVDFMNKLKVLTKCKTMLTHARKNRRWESGKMAEILNIKYNDWVKIDSPPAITADKRDWKRWEQASEKTILDLKRTMHLKHRMEFRKQISMFSAAMEASRQDSKM